MKTSLRVLLATLLLSLGSGAAFADVYNFDVTLAPKKTDSQKSQGNKGLDVTVQKWAYTVTMENHSFKDVPACVIKYVMFVKPEASKGGSKGGLERHEGSVTVAGVKNNDKFVFDTDAVQIVGAVLKPGYIWKDGDTGSPKDKLRGIWIRVYVDNQQVFEFINPHDLYNNESFDGTPK